jgi:aminomethyltransferase
MQMHAIHFEKGCYLGQEIVERIRARGHVNKTLARLEINTAAPPPAGTTLVVNGIEVGEITSAVFSPSAGKVLALGYVRVPHNQPGILLSAGEETARVM